MNNNFVTDTVALILKLEKRKLSHRVKTIFQNAENGETKIIIPVMVLAEVGYLSEKKRIDTTIEDVNSYYAKYSLIEIEPITKEIIEITFTIDDIAELHDRIIAATALHKGFELITNDPVISRSKYIKVVW
jgi:predicted nucleic acid-binding protein